jgi:ATP-binding cassette subfamily B protein
MSETETSETETSARETSARETSARETSVRETSVRKPSASSSTVDWRGVGAEDVDELPERIGVLLRARSRRLLRSLLRPHRRALWTLVGLVLVQNTAAMAGPWLVGVGIDRGIPALRAGDWRPLATVVAALLGCAAVDGVLRTAFLIRTGRIGQDVLFDLRRRVFDHFQRLSLAFHERYTSGRVVSRLTSDLDSLDELLDAGLDGLITAFLMVGSTSVILLLLDLPLALVTLATFVPLWLLIRWFRTRSFAAYRRTRESVAQLIVQFVESLGGIRAVQAFRREPRNEAIFGELNDDYRRANARSFRLIALFVPGVSALAAVATSVVLLYGGHRVLDGDLQVGVLASVLLYLVRLFDPMQDIAIFYNSFQSATAALEKLSGVLEEEPAVAEPEQPARLQARIPGAVSFRAVRFGYRDVAGVLPDLSLQIPAGQTVALVGPTGAGKSTLARLLARFYDPRSGQVLLDGIDLRRLTEADLRRAIVMVTQENFLFSGSVADNIAFGRPEAPRAEVEAAATAIGAHGFIAALPDGYDTDVRKRGGRLSAGQRQLVAFARAFLADPAVLILDEATSSLDVPSERLVQRALRTILADRTALIIAHRLSTVEIADRVLVMEAGRIVEDGAPADLITDAGRFAGLHRAWQDSLL